MKKVLVLAAGLALLQGCASSPTSTADRLAAQQQAFQLQNEASQAQMELAQAQAKAALLQQQAVQASKQAGLNYKPQATPGVAAPAENSFFGDIGKQLVKEALKGGLLP